MRPRATPTYRFCAFAAKESERSQVAISAIEFASTAMSFDSLAQEQSITSPYRPRSILTPEEKR